MHFYSKQKECCTSMVWYKYFRQLVIQKNIQIKIMKVLCTKLERRTLKCFYMGKSDDL